MTRKEDEDLIFQPHIFSEELLNNLEKIIRQEDFPFIRATIVPKLKQTTIPQQASMSVRYYKLGLSKHEADLILYVIHTAQRTNDKKTVYKQDRLLFLAQKWQIYCGSFG